MKESQEIKIKVLDALKTTPIITVACAKAGIARATCYRWLNDDSEFKKRAHRAMKSGAKNINDLAYGMLIQKIKQGSLGAITFYLGRRHPDFKKKEKIKVEVTQNNLPDFEIPVSAFDEVSVGKLPKKLRKRVIKSARMIQKLVQQCIENARRQGFDMGHQTEYRLQDTLPWGSILKSILEEEAGVIRKEVDVKEVIRQALENARKKSFEKKTIL